MKTFFSLRIVILSFLILCFFTFSCEDPEVVSPEEEPNNTGSVKILDFSPTEGQVDDTLLVIGKDFELNSSKLRIFLGGKESPRTILSNDTLICIVPQDLGPTPLPLVLEFEGNRSESNKKFTHVSPKIDSISLLFGGYGDTLTLFGENFHPRAYRNKVFFNAVSANILSATQNILTVRVPLELQDSLSQIKVKVQNTEDVFSQGFKVPSPTIFSLSKHEINIGETLVLEGANFHPSPNRNLIRFGGSLQEVISSSHERVEIRIKDQAFSQRKQRISIEILGRKVYSNDSLKIIDPWIRRAKLPVLDPMNYTTGTLAFTLDQEAYVGYKSRESANEIYTFDTKTAYFERKADYPGLGPEKPGVFTIGSTAYVGSGTASSGYREREGFIYEPQYDQWRTMNEFTGPLSTSDVLRGFSIGPKGYYISGIFGSLNFWEYDSENFTWIPKTSFPIPSENRELRPIFATNIQGKGYVVTQLGKPNNYLWVYDPVQNTWNTVTTLPFTQTFNTAFVLDEVFYVLGIDRNDDTVWYFYSYDLGSSTWTNLSQLASPPLFSTASFTLGGKAFFSGVLLGGRSRSRSEFMWEFDPNP